MKAFSTHSCNSYLLLFGKSQVWPVETPPITHSRDRARDLRQQGCAAPCWDGGNWLPAALPQSSCGMRRQQNRTQRHNGVRRRSLTLELPRPRTAEERSVPSARTSARARQHYPKASSLLSALARACHQRGNLVSSPQSRTRAL